MDSDKNANDKELTSTMGNVLSMTKKDEKGEANDATPTSSTDANTTSSAAQIAVSDDPISSTSSDLIEQNKMRETTCTSQADITLDKTNALPMAASVSDQAAVDADLLEMGMSNVPHEKITEDVEDLVQDLENLLGEAPDNFYVPRKSVKETVKEKVCEATEASTNLIPDVNQDNEQVSEQANVNETESSVEKNEVVEPIVESVTTETVAKETVVIDSTLTEPVCVKESVEVAEIEEKPMAVEEESVKEQEKEPEYSETDVELPARVLAIVDSIVENVENDEIESRGGIVPEETPVPPQDIIEDSIPVEKATQSELKPETVETSAPIEEVTESSVESKPETVKEAEIIPDEPMDVVDNIQNITEPLISDNSMDVCVNTKEPPIEIPECINSIPVEENEVVHSTILPPAPVIEQNLQELGEKIEEVSQPVVETDKPETETETIETPMEIINNQVENEVCETVPECTEQTQEDVPAVAKEEAKIESSIESGALQIDSIPEQISDFVEPITEIKQQPDTVIASDVVEEKGEDSVVNSLPVELIPAEPIIESVSDEKVEENVEAVLQPLEPCIEPENLETISGNSTIPIDEQFVPVGITENTSENTSVIDTNPQTIEPITDVEATVAPPPPPLDTYQGVEVEKAFGNDMPEDIVQTLPESIENLTQPPQMSVLEARLTAGNLNNLSNCSPVTAVKELDPIQQAVASIMNVQDNQIEDEIKQEIGELQVSAIPPITEHLMNNYPIENAVSITNISPPKEQLPVNMTDDVKVRSFECENNLNQPLTINIEDEEKKEKEYSPKVTIKPIKVPDEDISTTSGVDNSELGKASLKMTITKQSDNTHSILKIYNPDDVEHAEENDQVIPKIIIKPFMQQEQHSPKMKGSKQAYHSPTSSAQRSLSPRITIKPVLKPVESKQEPIGPVKITIKPVVKTEDTTKKHSPKLTIKPIVKPAEEVISEQVHSPRITIKPIPRPSEMEQDTQLTPTKLTIKTMRKNDEEMLEQAPKITIKPVVKPSDSDSHSTEEEEIKERIVLKINKGNLPTPSKEKKREHQDEDKSEKLAKIKVKLSKEGGHAHIVQQNESGIKRNSDELMEKSKRQKLEEYNQSSTDGDDSKGTDRSIVNISSPIVISEDSTQDSGSVILVEETKDHLSDIPVYDITGEQANKSQIPVPLAAVVPQPPVVVTPPMPRKRGRPRKVPLEVREEFKEIKDEPIKIEEQAMEQQQVPESGRPKRSCRGQNVRDTLGIKPRKPRGAGRGRGSKRGMGSRAIAMKPAKEPKLSKAKLKLLRESYEEQQAFDKLNTIVIDVDEKSEPMVFASPVHDFKTDHKNDPSCSRLSSIDTADIVMFEEETRMSAETSSRAQTPAKQVVSVEVEESQSSVQSTATTESGRTSRPNKTPRLEVHQEPEGAVISADQLAEYYWGGNGPFMLQEQVAQFLGINSFKRKYPGISRRMVDMQERDFIRESGLASEAMCDLGLTAVNSADILDIMYSDFQDKYEEYCKHQRDRQAKDLTNKQKALSLAASQEKTKLDITEQAIQSAAQWNLSFNKTRREQRKASMDLQTLTVHYPKGKTRAYSKGKIGNYPLALVPGQFTDYYQEYTPTEINNLPINTLCYDAIKIAQMEESEESEDGSDSDSECSSSSSESSDSSSGVEDCKLCKPSGMKRAALAKS